MSTISTGGLCGKARRQRERSRAARLYTQKLVDEYFEPDRIEPPTRRHIPIGRRREFLPSVIPTPAPDSYGRTDVLIAHEPTVQLDLPLGDRQADRALSFGVEPSTDGGEPPAVLLVKRPKLQHDRPSTTEHPSSTRSTRSSFTFGGFILGCAMGSAAAVMMLMVAQAVVR